VRRVPAGARVGVLVLLLPATWLLANWMYQAARKPAELFFPLSGTLSKTPEETWRVYGPLFRAHATAIITPELLAALAQVEGAGNPVARTYWRWQASWNPFKWYQPASSSVGMYQITDGTFEEAKRYCIHDHQVAEATSWHDAHGCWLNALYTRVIPSHAIEMTSGLLDHEVSSLVVGRRVPVTPSQKHDLAAMIHLCGAGGGAMYLQHGFRASAVRCGTEHPVQYLAAVRSAMRAFAALAERQ
jgi:hypothetical protein